VLDVADPVEIQRMLLWFKSTLPPHALDEWYITVRADPHPTVVEDTDTSVVHAYGGRQVSGARRVEGYGRCVRCGKCFRIPSSGNAIAFDESRVERVVEEMRRWVLRDAERDGPCWGDVPSIPHETNYAVADRSRSDTRRASMASRG
jgi:hypothetical protein